MAEASSGSSAMQIVCEHEPDIAIIDISLPDLSGIELARQITQRCPAVRILALTVHEDRAYVQPMLQAGARGYLLKRSAADELVRALRAISDGGMYLDPAITEKAFLFSNSESLASEKSVTADLTSRELEVLQFIARGFSNKEIGIRLTVSVKTIETYKARAINKLGLRTRADIVRYAAAHRWLDDFSNS